LPLSNVVLRASDFELLPHVGFSARFNVGSPPGALDHFSWSLIASPQYVDTPFAATITAKDPFENTVSNFTGTVHLSSVARGSEITIGNGEGKSVYPMATFFQDARSQVIYLASEIGPARRLSSLALNVATAPGQTLNNWTIRMKHTSLNSYS